MSSEQPPNKEKLSIEALEEISEYVGLIPLHTEDVHILRFVEQITKWCDGTLLLLKDD